MFDVKKLALGQVYVSNDYRRRVKILGFSKAPNMMLIAHDPAGMSFALAEIIGEGLPGSMPKTLFLAFPQFNAAGKSGYRPENNLTNGLSPK